MTGLKRAFLNLIQYPSAVAGLVIILLLVALAVYTLISLPYSEAVRLWRGADNVWLENPRNAVPAWYNLFPRVNVPVTTVVDSRDHPEAVRVEELGGGVQDVQVSLPFEFPYDGFPKEVTVFLTADFQRQRPNLDLSWHTPDGRSIRLSTVIPGHTETYRVSQDARLLRQLRTRNVERGLFGDPGAEHAVPAQGTYELLVEGLTFEEGSSFSARLVVYGQAHGLAGTDHRRRDLVVALMWGTPLALAFGFLAAMGSSITTMFIAAFGVWYGRWLDGLIQRITETNMILPVLPILIMIGTMYSRSIWYILGAVIALSIFSAGIKTYRAMFLQVKEAPYIEAARAYGASNTRIVVRYMVPKIIPVLIPGFVVLIPSFVFLEATLALLGLGDPILPTWGKVLNDANANGALHNGHYYWVLLPAFLLMLTGLGFSMVGFALDRIFNPRLRGI